MDLRAIKAAAGPELVVVAAAAAKNADGLARDAEILAESLSMARAYSLAALAVEEAGKAATLAGIASMPSSLREQAPVGLMLGWHQLKQSVGQLLAAVPPGPPGHAVRLLAIPEGDLARILSALKLPVDEADRLKRGGLYVDIGRDGRLREPSEITETEVTPQLARARQAADSIKVMLDPGAQARIVNPDAEDVELWRAAVNSINQAGYARTPDVAVDLVVKTLDKLRERVMGTTRNATLAAGLRGLNHSRGTPAAPTGRPARRGPPAWRTGRAP